MVSILACARPSEREAPALTPRRSGGPSECVPRNRRRRHRRRLRRSGGRMSSPASSSSTTITSSSSWRARLCLVIDLLDGDEPEHGEHEHRQRLATDAHITLHATLLLADRRRTRCEEGGHRTIAKRTRKKRQPRTSNRARQAAMRTRRRALAHLAHLHQHKTRATMTTKEVAWSPTRSNRPSRSR